MGCGPSKDANVATSNTVSTKSLQKNSIDSSNPTTSSTMTNPKVELVENEKGSEDVKDKDTTSEVESKFIAAGSPGRHFSPKKDEDVEEAAAASAGYASRLSETADGHKAEVVEAAKSDVVNGKESEDIEDKETTSEMEGKFVATGPPDRCFASRNDEETVVVLAGYASPLSDIADEEKVEVVETASDVVNGKESEDVEDKDTTSEMEGKFIAAGSPDRYFSSRKDEEMVAAFVGYASPLSEIANEEKAEVVEAASNTVNACEDFAAVMEVSGGNAEEAIMPKQEGKSADLKDTILVEGKERKETESSVV